MKHALLHSSKTPRVMGPAALALRIWAVLVGDSLLPLVVSACLGSHKTRPAVDVSSAKRAGSNPRLGLPTVRTVHKDLPFRTLLSGKRGAWFVWLAPSLLVTGSPVSNARQVSTPPLLAWPLALRVSRASMRWQEPRRARRVLQARPVRALLQSVLLTVRSAVLVSFLQQPSRRTAHLAAMVSSPSPARPCASTASRARSRWPARATAKFASQASSLPWLGLAHAADVAVVSTLCKAPLCAPLALLALHTL